MPTTTTSIASSIPTVMAWEFWTLARVRFLSALFGVACLNALFYHLVTMSLGELSAAVRRNFFLVIFFTDIFLIVLVLLRSRDADSRNGMELDARAFLLPLPTWQLVFLRMIYPVAAAGVLWVAVSLTTLAVTPDGATIDNWPLLGPAMVAAMFTAWGLAIFYFPLRPKPLKVLVGLAVMVRLIAWTLRGTGDGDPASRIWLSATSAEGVALVAFLLAAYATAVIGAAQARRGVTLGFPDIVGGVDALSYRWRRAVRGTFRSPATAHMWLEWRQKGWILPAMTAGVVVAARILWGRGESAEGVPRMLSILFGFLLFFTPPLMGCLMGRFNQTSRDASIDVFRASRPLSDAALANGVLRAAALSLAVTWVVMAGTVAAVLGVADLVGDGGQLDAAWRMVNGFVESHGGTDAAWSLAALLIVSWTSMALVASAFLTGRNKVVAALVFLPYALGISAFIVFEVLGEEAIGSLFIAASWILGGAALALTAAAFAVARRRRLIGAALPWVALALWLAAGLAVAWREAEWLGRIMESGVALERTILVLGPSLLALAVAPLALAPLALAWNRHR